jgi:co-chaperonin GroES (HSP10)
MDPALHEGVSPGGLLLVRPPLVRTGTVVAVGVGRLFVDEVFRATEVKVGERVAFLAATMDTKQGHQMQGTLGEERALIRESDILFVIEEGNPHLDK